MIQWGVDDADEPTEDLEPYRAAYLGPFGDSTRELRRALELALRLGWVCRAVNGHIAGELGPTRARLRMFLDGRV